MRFVFTAAELDFLRSQRIGRFATVGASGWPHVVPVMYTMNDDGSLDFDVDGVKLRNLAAETRAAMVVDAMGPEGHRHAGPRGADGPGTGAPEPDPPVNLGTLSRKSAASL